MVDLTDTQTIINNNVFKNDPGFMGVVTDINTDDPVEGVTVQFFKSDGKRLGTTYTDENGYYSYYHKHIGRADTFTVVLPYYEQQQTVILKAVKFAVSEFQVDLSVYEQEQTTEQPPTEEPPTEELPTEEPPTEEPTKGKSGKGGKKK